jgi:hypothetical protein
MFKTYTAKQPEVQAVQFDTPPKRAGMHSSVFEYQGETFTCANRLPCVGDYFVRGRGFMTKEDFRKAYAPKG